MLCGASQYRIRVRLTHRLPPRPVLALKLHCVGAEVVPVLADQLAVGRCAHHGSLSRSAHCVGSPRCVRGCCPAVRKVRRDLFQTGIRTDVRQRLESISRSWCGRVGALTRRAPACRCSAEYHAGNPPGDQAHDMTTTSTLSAAEFAAKWRESARRERASSQEPWGGKTSCGPPILMMQTS